MDLYVESQCIEQIRQGNLRQFLLLFDANFPAVYKYVFRRVGDEKEAERIVNLTFLDALGQASVTPIDVSFVVWLYSLAKPRVWDYLERNSLPEKRGLIAVSRAFDDDGGEVKDEEIVKVEKMMGKLSLEEREILRLKFFEEVSDADVMLVLGMSDVVIGPKIYRVLKRAHFLMFGESDDKQGVYFGELAGILSRVRDSESVFVPEALKLHLRLDLTNRIERKDFAIEAEEIRTKPFVDLSENAPKGSSDPAKIFVEAVKEMRDDAELERLKQEEKLEKKERLYDFIDRWKRALLFVPLAVFLAVFGVVVWKVVFSNLSLFPVERAYVTTCGIEVNFVGDFADGEIRSVNKGVSDRLCDKFQVKRLEVSRLADGKVGVTVDTQSWDLNYKFVKKVKEWRIKEYERTANSDKKSGKISGNFRSTDRFRV